MLRNYAIVAWRNIKKHKFFTLINVMGLALSMSVCLFIISLLVDHLSYDNFHQHKDSIYRITTYYKGQSGIFSGSASTTAAFNDALPPLNSSIIRSCLLTSWNGDISSEDKILEAHGYYVDSSFFEVFNFQMDAATPMVGINDPYTVLISQEFSEKLFPNKNAVGSILTLKDDARYQIIGVFPENTRKSHINFDVLISLATLRIQAQTDFSDEKFDSWNRVWQSYIYLQLSESVDLEILENQMNQLANENIELKEHQEGYEFKLQPLNSITPGVPMGNELKFRFPWFIIVVFIVLGFIVILTSTINYANLTIAKGINRAREVGVRKANGGTRQQIVIQFLIESVLVSVLALGFAVIFYFWLLGEFNSLWIMSQVGLQITHSNFAILFFVIFSLILGLLTGIAPALYLSKYKIVDALKNRKAQYHLGRSHKFFNTSNLLMSVQFILATILLISIFILEAQIDHLMKSDFGFDEKGIYQIDLQGNDSKLAVAQYTKLPDVAEFALTSHHPAVGVTYGETIRRKMEDNPTESYHFFTAGKYIETLSIPILAGRAFNPSRLSQNETEVVVNETLIERMNFNNPHDAIGKALIFDDSLTLIIIGVVADYHFQPLINTIEPMALRYKPDQCGYLYLKLGATNSGSVTNVMTQTWAMVDNKRSLKAGYLEDELRVFYSGFIDIGKLFSLIALLAIVITSMGLGGMVSFTLKNREKEIAIRKVLGASYDRLIWLLLKEFGLLTVIALLIATPVSVVLNRLWLEQLASRIGIGIGVVLPAIAIICMLCAVIILGQTFRYCRKNPTAALNSE